MAISVKILKHLDENKYKYEIIDHKTTYTAWDTSQTEKVKPQEVAKALVMKADSDYLIAMLSSNKNLDKPKLLKVINAQRKKAVHPVEYPALAGYRSAVFHRVKKIDFAKEPWMKKNLPGKVGAVPPFSQLLKMEIYADNLLMKNKKIFVGSGEYTQSFRISSSQFAKSENVVKGSFSKSKK